MSSFAIAQPVLDIMGRSPEFFIFRGANARVIWIFAFLTLLVPPILLLIVEEVFARKSVKSCTRLHLLFLLLLGYALSFQVLSHIGVSSAVARYSLALTASMMLLLARSRLPTVRTFVRYLSASPVFFLISFLALSPVAPLALPYGERLSSLPAAGSNSDVVILLLDELPLMSLLDAHGRVDADLFPNFASLANSSTWFRNTTAPSGETVRAVPAMLTGNLPKGRPPPVAGAFPRNLFSLFAGVRDLRVQESVTALCPPAECSDRFVRSTGLVTLLRDASRLFRVLMSSDQSRSNPADSLVEEMAFDSDGTIGSVVPRPSSLDRLLDSFGKSPRPALHFLHLLMPHTPFRYFPSGRAYAYEHFNPEGSDPIRGPVSWLASLDFQRHILQLRYTDVLLGRVIERLKLEHMYDSSLLIVISDHGRSFLANEPHRLSITNSNAGQVAWVPFFVKAPGQRLGKVFDHNVLTLDLVPTVIDALNIDYRWQGDGVSAYSNLRPDNRKPWVNYPDVYRNISAASWLPKVLRGFPVLQRAGFPARQRPYLIGPYPELIFAPLEQFPVGSDSGATVSPIGAAVRRHFDLGAGNVPGLIHGEVSPGSGRKLSVVISLNGVIGAVVPTFDGPESSQEFVALMPEELFRQGSNELSFFLVQARNGMTTLRPMALRE